MKAILSRNEVAGMSQSLKGFIIYIYIFFYIYFSAILVVIAPDQKWAKIISGVSFQGSFSDALLSERPI